MIKALKEAVERIPPEKPVLEVFMSSRGGLPALSSLL
jgi:hypothetical protein